MMVPTVAEQFVLGSTFNWNNLRLVMRGEILENALEWHKQYGDVVRIRIGSYWVYLLAHPKDISYVLVENYKNFSKETPGYKGLRNYLGDGLLSTFNLKKWSRNRKIVQPLFQREQILNQVPIFLRRAQSITDRLTSTLQGNEFDLSAAMTTLTLAVLGEAILNCDLESESSRINKAIRAAFNHATSGLYNPLAVPLLIPTPKNFAFLRAKCELQKTVGKIIRAQHPTETKNLLNVFRKASASVDIPEQEIFDEFLTMIQAGHETTANALNWLFLHLHQNPEVLRHVQDEVRDEQVFASYQTMESTSYLHKVILESMRMDPVVWGFDRRVLETCSIGGYSIPSGSFIMISPYVTHKHSEFWPNPERFDPSRFDIDKIKARPKLAYLPFGAGPRVCIGQQFAVSEMKIIAATILQKGRIEILNQNQIEREPSITLRPKVQLKARLVL